MLKTQEHYDLMAQFEREHIGRFDKEPKEYWPRGIIYQDGRVNELFLTYRRGYAFGKTTAPAQDAERERDAERYRALVESGAYSPGRFPSCPWGLRTGNEKATKAELDEAVDAARAQRAAAQERPE